MSWPFKKVTHPMPGTANVAVRHTRERMLSLAMLAATFAGELGHMEIGSVVPFDTMSPFGR
jgi:hypothetical protein